MFIASFELSHNIAFFAPLLAASNPIAPLPANKSRNTLSCMSCCIILNNDSFTLSNVGLVFKLSNVYSFVPLAVPLIILVFVPFSYDIILFFFFYKVNTINRIVTYI